ncbi:VpaChn25_0724 family phage protein [Nitrincola iocasae]|uniref:ArsR family transcriptional regulator n=1 Tax=Nitrincola iocasae TaxID=2614693 RepID=A0A5J6LAS6_9GAMM|nr:ArsR family transcriptional regulator [Nitrincola iocasae]QEW05643.1 ArsR family transcriptional regulator [Nitrincola iocasae]
MTYQEEREQHQRLCILRTLNEQTGYRANESFLMDVLSRYALDLSRDALRTQLAWLAEQRLITTEQLGSTTIASITQRGQDVSRGLATLPGIKRPSAGA